MSEQEFTLWVPIEKIARAYGKPRMSIYRWCMEGFIFTLGYKVKLEPKNHWLIGVPPNHPERERIASI